MSGTDTTGAQSENPVLQTFDEVLEAITNGATPQQSVGTLIDWVVQGIETASKGGTLDAVLQGVGELGQALAGNKEAIGTAVAAAPASGQ